MAKTSNYPAVPKKFHCLNCGQPFPSYKTGKSFVKYCSNACREYFKVKQSNIGKPLTTKFRGYTIRRIVAGDVIYDELPIYNEED